MGESLGESRREQDPGRASNPMGKDAVPLQMTPAAQDW